MKTSMFRSTSARFAAVYTAGFALSVVVLGAITLVLTHNTLTYQFERRVGAESRSLAQEYRIEGLAGVADAVREREHIKGGLF